MGLDKIRSQLEEYLWSGVDLTDIENGGEDCKYYMTMTFKLSITIIHSILYIIIIKSLWNRVVFLNKNENKQPVLWEKFLGYTHIILYILQIYFKSHHSRTTIFMLNPCHTLNLIQGIILISKSTRTMRILNLLSAQLVFCGLAAFINPITTDLTPLEIFAFWLEHWLIVFISPIAIIIGGRYYDDNTLRFDYHIICHCLFAMYQRLFLFPISELSLINLNFSMCPSLSK